MNKNITHSGNLHFYFPLKRHFYFTLYSYYNAIILNSKYNIDHIGLNKETNIKDDFNTYGILKVESEKIIVPAIERLRLTNPKNESYFRT